MSAYPEIPGYKIESHLGIGRLTVVFQAVASQSGNKVVIKALNPELEEDSRFGKRFLYEMRRAVQLTHPNIAAVMDAGEASGYFYFVQEYFPDNLRRRITDRNLALSSGKKIPLDPHVVLDILRQLCDGLDYAHQNSIPHRDIRPENIFFREDGTPALADFFIPELVRASKTLTERRIAPCPLHYASPEQILKKSFTPASDIYSLGVTLCEMLSGRPPYDAEEPIAIENMHVMDPVPTLPEEFAQFQELLDRMMAKESLKRAQSCVELILLMEEIGETEASGAPPGPQPPAAPPPAARTGGESTEDIIGELDLQLEGAGNYWNEAGSAPPPPPPPPPAPAAKRPFASPAPPAPAPSATKELTFQEIDDLDFSAPPAATGGKTPLSTGYSQAPAIGERIVFPAAPPTPAPPPPPPADDSPDIGDDDSLDLFSQGVPPRRDDEKDDEPVRLPRIPIEPGASGIQGLLERIKNPKILGVAGGALVLAIVFVLLILPRLGGGQPENTNAKPAEETLSPEEIRERDNRCVEEVNKARLLVKENKLKEAAQAANAASKLKKSPEVEKLKSEIAALQAKEAEERIYAAAVKAGTPDNYRAYLDKYPNGLYAEDAKNKINILGEQEQKLAEARRQWAAKRIRLRSEPIQITHGEARDMIAKRGFYERYYNKKGDFNNFFELQVIEQQKLVTDNASGLMWLQSGSDRALTYTEAEAWVKLLNDKKFAGFANWRIPSLEEALSLLEPVENRVSLFIDPVFNKELKYMWTCDHFSKNQIWVVDFFAGDTNRISPESESYVRPVREIE